MYFPTSDEKYLNLEKECECILDKDFQNSNSVSKIPIGIYSLNEMEVLLNNCGQN